MDYHRKALSNSCRICGERALKTHEIKRKQKARQILHYVGLIKLYFAIDISKDEKDIHPQVLCNDMA